MRPARAARFACGAHCLLGCRCGAKWHAGEYSDEAVARGAELRTGALVRRIRSEGGRVTGVDGVWRGQPFRAEAETVVVAAGGIGTPRLLQASGLRGAGEGLTMDTTVIVYGLRRRPGLGGEPPMTWSWEDLDAGYMLSTLIDPWLLFPLMAALKGTRYALHWPRWGEALGVMIKLRDEIAGGVYADRITKPQTPRDRERLAAAEALARRLLVEAGAERDTVFTSPLRGTHPSGTVRIGTLVDTNLQTEVRGLYVCDAATFPEALGRPTVLTIIGLGKRLARHLAPA